MRDLVPVIAVMVTAMLILGCCLTNGVDQAAVAVEHPKKSTVERKVHERILRFFNAARRPEDLMKRPRRQTPLRDDRLMHGVHEDEEEERSRRKPLFDRELAERVLAEKERQSPIYGFQHIRQLQDIPGFDASSIAALTSIFGAATKGEWEVVYDGLAIDETPTRVYHAALLRTGWVLFLPRAYSSDTVLWNPEDADPVTAFKQLSGATTGLGTNSLVCSGHSFLSDGRLLAMGGDSPTSNKAWKFDPDTEMWTQTSGNMSNVRWYPTAVTLGDDSGRVLVANGRNGGADVSEIEIYSESTDSFTRAWGPGGIGDTGADRSFPKLYPGLHLLPDGQIFHTRVGDRTGLPDETAYFTFSAPDRGSWTDLAGGGSGADRYSGMSALLLRQNAADPDRVLVVGGGNPTAQLEIAIMNNPGSAASTWVTGTFPDGLPRDEVNVVLLPDGTAFISGGRPLSGMPPNGGASWIYDPAGGIGAGAFAEMDSLEFSRKHHSVALLLPSGKVMTTGGSSRKIEVFSPPYLFNPDGSDAIRPQITSYPDPDLGAIVLHGSTFEVGTPNPTDIASVVLVRPMAVTHQTDTEQRVIRLSATPSGATTLSVTAPDGRVYPYGAGGGHTHAVAGRGYYMLFIINTAGVPSVAKFIRLR